MDEDVTIFEDGSQEEFDEAESEPDMAGFEDEEEEDESNDEQIDESIFDKDEPEVKVKEQPKKIIKPKEVAKKSTFKETDIKSEDVMAKFYIKAVDALNLGTTNEQKAALLAQGFAEAINPLIEEVRQTKNNTFSMTPEGKFYEDIKRDVPSISKEAAAELFSKLHREQQVMFTKNQKAIAEKKQGLTSQEKKIAKRFGMTDEEYIKEKKGLIKGNRGNIYGGEIIF